MLKDKKLPFFEDYGISLLRILTDRGTEYCGTREHHEYQLYLALEDIDHTRTKARNPQTNGICERLNCTIQDEFYAMAFRKKIYSSIEEIQSLKSTTRTVLTQVNTVLEELSYKLSRKQYL